MTKDPSRWHSSDEAIKAVQVAFDVEDAVLNAIRKAAFEGNLSTSDQIRLVLGLPVTRQPKRPRLTVSLAPTDYGALGERYGIDPADRLAIKERVLRELVVFAETGAVAQPATASKSAKLMPQPPPLENPPPSPRRR